MSYDRPRGTQDILPPLSDRFQDHEERGRALFESAGYRRIITPMFEDTDLFVRGVGDGSDIVTKEMYTFEDRSGNPLTLRPEGTAPAMRAVISNAMWDEGLPVKVWYSAPMFRYDRPQRGRYRQHHQLGIEAVGTDDPTIDAEVILLGSELLQAAGAGRTELVINSIGDLRHEACRVDYLPALRAFLERHADELDEDCRRRTVTNPLRTFDCKRERDQEILADAPTVDGFLCGPCREHFAAVLGILTALGVEHAVDPRLVRGLDYYSRTTFEFRSSLLDAAQSTVCGGGRYDPLIEMLGGPSLPGIGFGSGIERVLLAQEAAGAAAEAPGPDCMVIPVGDEPRRAMPGIARDLRAAGLRVEMGVDGRGLKAQMKRANKLGVRHAVIIGEDEMSRGGVTVRDMTSGEQSTVPLSEAIDRMRPEADRTR